MECVRCHEKDPRRIAGHRRDSQSSPFSPNDKSMTDKLSFPSLRSVRRPIITVWASVAIGAIAGLPAIIGLPPRFLWIENVGVFVMLLALIVGFASVIYGIATMGRPRDSD